MDNVKQIFGDQVSMSSDPYEALMDADALAIITEWSVFRTPSLKVMKGLLNAPVIFDGRNLYDMEMMSDNGFYYQSIGRKKIYDRDHS